MFIIFYSFTYRPYPKGTRGEWSFLLWIIYLCIKLPSAVGNCVSLSTQSELQQRKKQLAKLNFAGLLKTVKCSTVHLHKHRIQAGSHTPRMGIGKIKCICPRLIPGPRLFFKLHFFLKRQRAENSRDLLLVVFPTALSQWRKITPQFTKQMSYFAGWVVSCSLTTHHDNRKWHHDFWQETLW